MTTNRKQPFQEQAKQVKKVKKIREFHIFSMPLAKDLNPKTPDISAAIVHYTLYTWQRSNKLPGPKKAFRSIRQLEEELSYLNRTVIHDAVKRLETANMIVVDRSKDKLHFQIPEEVVRKYMYNLTGKGRAMISVLIGKAIEHGVLESILLGNLSYMMKNFDGYQAVDDAGIGYYRLDPKYLKNRLPRSKKAITGALESLRVAKVIVEHPTKKWHFRYVPEPDGQLPVPDIDLPNPDRKVSKPDSKQPRKARRSAPIKAEKAARCAVDSKVDVTVDLKEDGKDHLQIQDSPSASPDSAPLNISSFAKSKIGELISSNLFTNKQLIPLDEMIKFAGDIEITEVTRGEFDFGELPYDYIPRDRNGKVLSWDEYIDDYINDWKDTWSRSEFTYTEDDIIKLRKIMSDNRQMSANEFEELIHGLNLFTPDLMVVDGNTPIKRGEWQPDYFHNKVKSLGAFLKYLPQIIKETYGTSSWEDGKIEWDFDENDMPDSIYGLYKYLEPEPIGVEYVTDDKNPNADK
ncbi:hypothetical protein BH09VER1_BH09VER1_23800 [soil metagenome]